MSIAFYAKIDINKDMRELAQFINHEHEEPTMVLRRRDFEEIPPDQILFHADEWREWRDNKSHRDALALLQNYLRIHRRKLESTGHPADNFPRTIPEAIIKKVVDVLVQTEEILLPRRERMRNGLREAERLVEDWENWPRHDETSTEIVPAQTEDHDGSPSAKQASADSRHREMPSSRRREGLRRVTRQNGLDWATSSFSAFGEGNTLQATMHCVSVASVLWATDLPMV
jgi:hypothetical protein